MKIKGTGVSGTALGVLVSLCLSCSGQAPAFPYEGTIPPQSGQFYKTAYYDGTVSIADCQRDTPHGRMVATAALGLINKDTAQAYMYMGPHHVRQFADTERPYEILKPAGSGPNPGLRSLFANFSDRFETIYVWDPEEEWTWNLAIMYSSHNNGLPLMEYQIEEVLSAAPDWNGGIVRLKGQYTTKEEAYDFAIEHFMPVSHPSIMFSVGLRSDWQSNPWIIYDYAVATKGFAFWLDDADEHERSIIRKICEAGSYEPGAVVMGYAKSGDDLLEVVNNYGIGYVVSDYYANATFWSSYPNKSFRQPPGKPVEAEPGKVYVSVTMSDGDNVQFDQNALYILWSEDPAKGRVPMGTTMCAGLQELNPFLLEWFYKNMTENDELMAGPSGYQFIYGRDYSEEGYEKWLQLNHDWIASAGFETGCFWHETYGTHRFKRYIETSGLKGIFEGDDTGVISYHDGIIVMNQGDHLVTEGDLYGNLADRYRRADHSKPLFINTYPTAASWGHMGFSRMEREIARVEEDFPGVFVFLLPKDLVATASKYYKENPHERPVH